MPEPLCLCLLEKIHEQIERSERLINSLPSQQLTWTPAIPGAWPVSRVFKHLTECLAGFCAVLAAVEPHRLSHFAQLREIRTGDPATVPEAVQQIAVFRAHIDEGFSILRDEDLARRIPTVFVPKGEPVLTLLLGNLEHLINHKHQLFMYLKLMGVALDTGDLYRLRSDS
jgi:hypothetical protein